MSTRRPLQPLSPLSANIVGAKHGYIAKTVVNVHVSAMDARVQDEDTQEGSIVSGLTELEESADDFEKLLIQNARDERRLHDALRGNIQPFRKARKHPRAALTLESLERNEAASNAPAGVSTQRTQPSPPSASSGSSRSDTGVRPPHAWGRKGRVRRDWMRTITSDEEQVAGAGAQEYSDGATPRPAAGADDALPSVEDSPLSRKSSRQGTPASTRRRQAQQDLDDGWDNTLELNEASMLVSTPFIPRNTALDEIRQREIESLREQAVTTNRLDRIREGSPHEMRRPRSSSAKSLTSETHQVTTTEQAIHDVGSQEIRLRKSIESWKTIGKSQPSTSEGTEQATQPPFAVHRKSSETVGVVDRGVLANGQTSPQRPTHRREDSHELLRRLARVSSGTPSPGRPATSRPQTAPTRQDDNPIQPPPPPNMPSTSVPDLRSLERGHQEPTADESAPQVHSEGEQSGKVDVKEEADPAPETEHATPPVDVDTTPIPIEQSQLEAKTPQVMGGWIDTPAPLRTAPPPNGEPSTSSRKRSPIKRSPQKRPAVRVEEPPEPPTEPVERTRPNLPTSALGAILEEARTQGRGRRREDSYGDSTIDSLEEMIAPDRGGDRNSEETGPDEDTLQGLQLPTGAPRNEAERQRQQELIHLHRMNDRLRAARTSIRDANRGMKRVEHVIEHDEDGGRVQTIYRECPCGANGCHQTLWQSFKKLFYNKENTRRTGLTWLAIGLISFLVWFIAEDVACEYHCHKLYGETMRGFGVDWDAPRWPFVIPTLIYRNAIAFWWVHLWAFLSWVGRTAWNCMFESVDEQSKARATKVAQEFATKVWQSSQYATGTYEHEEDYRMGDDEAI
ncbi:hypothetical protein P154DRAFT_563887 [Amniculicola lignicola CBS 123094]|uniref:Uncharacterized protein n=1 Tax=Amniculicola lignicola CBS 123094 TaxID=1392246 RepID=A0A6A5WKE4_9PLEO|nr:hypothetical protein P154DRAFT_563887 [Amniculicola lignicola CBS 123094]